MDRSGNIPRPGGPPLLPICKPTGRGIGLGRKPSSSGGPPAVKPTSFGGTIAIHKPTQGSRIDKTDGGANGRRNEMRTGDKGGV